MFVMFFYLVKKIKQQIQRNQRFCSVTVTVPSLGVINRPTSFGVLNRPKASFSVICSKDF